MAQLLAHLAGLNHRQGGRALLLDALRQHPGGLTAAIVRLQIMLQLMQANHWQFLGLRLIRRRLPHALAIFSRQFERRQLRLGLRRRSLSFRQHDGFTLGHGQRRFTLRGRLRRGGSCRLRLGGGSRFAGRRRFGSLPGSGLRCAQSGVGLFSEVVRLMTLRRRHAQQAIQLLGPFGQDDTAGIHQPSQRT